MEITKKELIDIAYKINRTNWIFETNSQSFFKLVEESYGRNTLKVYSGEILRNKFTTPTDLGLLSVSRRAILYAEEPERERKIRFDISCESSYFEDKFFSSSVRKLYEYLLTKSSSSEPL